VTRYTESVSEPAQQLPRVANNKEIADEWDKDTPLAVTAGPWGEPGLNHTAMWGRYNPEGAARVYKLLGEVADKECPASGMSE
jgi:hypothetical protein